MGKNPQMMRSFELKDPKGRFGVETSLVEQKAILVKVLRVGRFTLHIGFFRSVQGETPIPEDIYLAAKKIAEEIYGTLGSKFE